MCGVVGGGRRDRATPGVGRLRSRVLLVDVAAARRLGAGEELGRVRELDVVREVRAAAARVT